MVQFLHQFIGSLSIFMIIHVVLGILGSAGFQPSTVGNKGSVWCCTQHQLPIPFPATSLSNQLWRFQYCQSRCPTHLTNSNILTWRWTLEELQLIFLSQKRNFLCRLVASLPEGINYNLFQAAHVVGGKTVSVSSRSSEPKDIQAPASWQHLWMGLLLSDLDVCERQWCHVGPF